MERQIERYVRQGLIRDGAFPEVKPPLMPEGVEHVSDD